MSDIDPTEQPRFVETFRSKPQVGEVLPKAEFIPLPELTAGPSGWYTIPKLVRFVVWVYTILALIGLVIGAVSLLVMLIGGGLALSQM